MVNKKMCKLLVAVLFTVLVDGLAAQQIGKDYTVANVEYLGDFETDNPRDRAISETVARTQRQNPGFAYERVTGQINSLEVHLVTRAYDQTNENAGVDSTYAVFISSEARRYIIFIQYLPFANNPYYYWVFRGNKK